jgi:hypothetical protein
MFDDLKLVGVTLDQFSDCYQFEIVIHARASIEHDVGALFPSRLLATVTIRDSISADIA